MYIVCKSMSLCPSPAEQRTKFISHAFFIARKRHPPKRLVFPKNPFKVDRALICHVIPSLTRPKNNPNPAAQLPGTRNVTNPTNSVKAELKATTPKIRFAFTREKLAVTGRGDAAHFRVLDLLTEKRRVMRGQEHEVPSPG